MTKAKSAFTLIEVMISVLIISTVIMALITMNGNSSHLFSNFKKQIKINQYASFFISNKEYGLENDSVNLDDLVSEFNLEDELRKELKDIKVEIIYQLMDQIDMSDFEDTAEDEDEIQEDENQEEDKEVISSLIIEIGKTVLKAQDSSVSLLRIKIQ